MHGEYTPLMCPILLRERLAKRHAMMDDILGLQKLCPRCREFWPQDTLFFSLSSHRKDGLQIWCKACQSDHKQLKP